MRKMKYMALVGVVIAVLSALMLPASVSAGACDIITGDCICIDEDNVLHTQVCYDCIADSNSGWLKWYLYEDGTEIDWNWIAPIAHGACALLDYQLVDPAGHTYTIVVKKWDANTPGDGYKEVLELEECLGPCAPVPETSTIALMSVGALALGAFVLFKRRGVEAAIS